MKDPSSIDFRRTRTNVIHLFVVQQPQKYEHPPVKKPNMGNRLSGPSVVSPEDQWNQPLARKGTFDDGSPFVMMGRTSAEHPTTYFIFGPPEGMATLKTPSNPQSVAIRRLIDPTTLSPEEDTSPGSISFLDRRNSVTLSAVELKLVRGEEGEDDDTAFLYDHLDGGDIEIAQVESSTRHKNYQGMVVYTPNGLRPFAKFQGDKWSSSSSCNYIFRDCSHRQQHGVVGTDRVHWAFRSQVLDGKSREVVAKVEGVGGWKKNAARASEHAQQNDWDRSTDQYLELTVAPGVDHGAVILMVLNKYILSNCQKPARRQ